MATVPDHPPGGSMEYLRPFPSRPDYWRLAYVHDWTGGHEPDPPATVDPNGVRLARKGLLRSVRVRDHAWNGTIQENK